EISQRGAEGGRSATLDVRSWADEIDAVRHAATTMAGQSRIIDSPCHRRCRAGANQLTVRSVRLEPDRPTMPAGRMSSMKTVFAVTCVALLAIAAFPRTTTAQ